MALIVWNSGCVGGVDRPDADHIMIFSLISHIEADADWLEQPGALHDADEKTASPEIRLEIVELLGFWLESHIPEMDTDYNPILSGAAN